MLSLDFFKICGREIEQMKGDGSRGTRELSSSNVRKSVYLGLRGEELKDIEERLSGRGDNGVTLRRRKSACLLKKRCQSFAVNKDERSSVENERTVPSFVGNRPLFL